MIGSFYVARTGRIHPVRPHIADVELIDGDATAVVRPYLAVQERAAQSADDSAPSWIGDLPVGSTG